MDNACKTFSPSATTSKQRVAFAILMHLDKQDLHEYGKYNLGFYPKKFCSTSEFCSLQPPTLSGSEILASHHLTHSTTTTNKNITTRPKEPSLICSICKEYFSIFCKNFGNHDINWLLSKPNQFSQ